MPATMKREFRRTTLITIACVAVLCGLALARLYDYPGVALLSLTILAVILLRRNRTIALLLLVALSGLLVGWWRGSIYFQDFQNLKNLSGQKVTIVATAKTDGLYANKAQLQFEAGSINLEKPYSQDLPGTFKISGFNERAVYRGDIVRVSGKLYLTRGSKQASISYAQLDRIGVANNWLDTVRHDFIAGTYNALPEPAASFSLGLLIGQRSTLPQEVLLALSVVGLTHIIAVSGYNLTILARAANRLTFLRSRFQKLVVSAVLIGVFVLITGFSASIVRAALVAGLGLWAWYFGRKIRPLLVIFLVAAITALWNPFYLWSDIGWYLSFLAFFGVLVLAPLLVQRFFRTKRPKLVGMMLLETIGAQIMVYPLIMYIFGQFSVVALLANLLVVPLVPLAMLAGLIAGIGGMMVPQLAAWFAVPAKVLLTFMLDIAQWLSAWPLAQLEISISLVQMLLLYTCIIVITVLLIKKYPLRRKMLFDE